MIKSAIRKTLGTVGSERLKRLLSTLRRPRLAALPAGRSVAAGWTLEQFTIKHFEVFFGYYDKRQLSLDGKRLLAGAVSSDTVNMQEPNAEMSVGWFDTSDKYFNTVGTTAAFNWQQGCMLRWVPQSLDNLVTFNDYRGGTFVSVTIEATTGKELFERPYASYDCAPCGELIATCDFTRLHRFRIGYGYWQKNTRELSEPIDSDNCNLIKIFDARDNAIIKIINLQQIRTLLGCNIFKDHVYVNHLSFSPDSKKLIFLVYWWENGISHMAALFFDRPTDELKIITKNYMSHYCWETNETLVAWGADNKDRRGYFRYNVSDRRQTAYWLNSAISDGHCSIRRDGTMLTDTYPDAHGIQTLMTRDSRGEITQLAQLHSPARFNFDRRCDLHPRQSQIDDCYTFDSACGGRRSTYLIQRK